MGLLLQNYFLLGLAAVCTGHSGIMLLPLWLSPSCWVRAATLYLHCFCISWSQAREGRVRKDVIINQLCFIPGNIDCLTTALHLCTVPLSLSLSSAIMSVNHSGWNAASAPPTTLGCPVRAKTLPFTASTSAEATLSIKLHLKIPSLYFPLSCLSCFLPYAHLHMCPWTDLSDMFLCLAGNLLLSCACSTCGIFKGRNQDDFLLCLPWCHSGQCVLYALLNSYKIF